MNIIYQYMDGNNDSSEYEEMRRVRLPFERELLRPEIILSCECLKTTNRQTNKQTEKNCLNKRTNFNKMCFELIKLIMFIKYVFGQASK